MKKVVITTISILFIALSAFANENFIQNQYPALLGDCRVMYLEDDSAACIRKVIVGDFRKSGDNLYYIVLGTVGSVVNGVVEDGSAHAIGGLVDLYAFNTKDEVIKLKGIGLGSFGTPPTDWEFIEQEKGNIALSTETCYIGQGLIECTKTIFSANGDKFSEKSYQTSSSYCPAPDLEEKLVCSKSNFSESGDVLSSETCITDEKGIMEQCSIEIFQKSEK